MRMQSLTRRISGLLSVILMTQAALGTQVARADEDPYNLKELEAATSHYLWMHTPEGPDPMPRIAALTTDVVAKTIAAKVYALPPADFNDFHSGLLVNYRQKPQDRIAIEKLFGYTREKVALELREYKAQHPVFTIINAVFAAWTVVYVFGMGKGFYKAKIQRAGRWIDVARAVEKELTFTAKEKALLYGSGLAIGVAQVAIQSFETHRLDPAVLLSATQDDVVTDLQKRMVAARDEFDLLTDEMVDRYPEQVKGSLRGAQDEVNEIKAQMQHMSEAAPQYRSRIDLIFQDLIETQLKIFKMQLKFNPTTDELQTPMLP